MPTWQVNAYLVDIRGTRRNLQKTPSLRIILNYVNFEILDFMYMSGWESIETCPFVQSDQGNTKPGHNLGHVSRREVWDRYSIRTERDEDDQE